MTVLSRFVKEMPTEKRENLLKNWRKAVERSRGWAE